MLQYFIYSLFAVTLGILFAIIKKRYEGKAETSSLLVNSLMILSFLLVMISNLILLLATGVFNFSIASEPLNLIVLSLMIFIILGALLIMLKEKNTKKWTSDAASLILVSDLLILSFLTGFSIGARLAFINLMLTLLLLVKAQHYKLIFYFVSALNLFFLASYFLF